MAGTVAASVARACPPAAAATPLPPLQVAKGGCQERPGGCRISPCHPPPHTIYALSPSSWQPNSSWSPAGTGGLPGVSMLRRQQWQTGQIRCHSVVVVVSHRRVSSPPPPPMSSSPVLHPSPPPTAPWCLPGAQLPRPLPRVLEPSLCLLGLQPASDLQRPWLVTPRWWSVTRWSPTTTTTTTAAIVPSRYPRLAPNHPPTTLSPGATSQCPDTKYPCPAHQHHQLPPGHHRHPPLTSLLQHPQSTTVHAQLVTACHSWSRPATTTSSSTTNTACQLPAPSPR